MFSVYHLAHAEHLGYFGRGFFQILFGLEEIDRGQVLVEGINVGKLNEKNLYTLRRKIGVVFQDYKLLDDRNLFENVALPLHVLGHSAREIPERVEEALELVGLEGKDHHLPNELSGGEQQRACLARAHRSVPVPCRCRWIACRARASSRPRIARSA